MSNWHAFLIVYVLSTTCAIEPAASGINHTKCIAPETAQDKSSRQLPACRAIGNTTTDILEEIFKISQQKLKSKQPNASSIGNFATKLRIKKRHLTQWPMGEATNQFHNNYGSTNELPFINSGMQDAERCNPYSRYRTIDGRCNNLRNPRWGSAMNCQPRLLPPNYRGTSGFRVSVDGQRLPRPRRLSLNVHYDSNRPSSHVSHMYIFFGQLLTHDIAQTPLSNNISVNRAVPEAILCCPLANGSQPSCAPISASSDDPFYSQFGVTCINFARSASCPTSTLGPKQLTNGVTSFIDASVVYGVSENQTRSLRTYDGTGRLRFYRTPYEDLLPLSSDPRNDQCSFPQTNEICFQAGDDRANQHTGLTSLHTIFLREHNRIATVLRHLNPHWDDERLFQESRRILGAQMQAITYKEYLPITLGNKRMSYYNLRAGRRTRYYPRIDPTTLVEFTTAAFRFGHSMINSIVTNWPLNDTYQPRLLRDEFFQPFDLYRGLIGPLVEGASNSPAQSFDAHLVQDVTNYLYRLRGNATGLDLASIDIQRGRDHGLPTYVDAVHYCFQGRINIRRFSDLISSRLMRYQQARVLRNNYRFVQDIDLWSGILNEIKIPGAVVGPTAACIIGLQFNSLKYGDRFYFEHMNEAGSFTFQQLRELRKVTLSQILCLNTEVKKLPRNAMLLNCPKNPFIRCRDVRGIDLSHWEELVDY